LFFLFFVRSSHSLLLSLLFSALSLLFFSHVSPPLSCPSLFSLSPCLFSASVFIGREGRWKCPASVRSG
jgi:hypothetical protein